MATRSERAKSRAANHRTHLLAQIKVQREQARSESGRLSRLGHDCAAGYLLGCASEYESDDWLNGHNAPSMRDMEDAHALLHGALRMAVEIKHAAQEVAL